MAASRSAGLHADPGRDRTGRDRTGRGGDREAQAGDCSWDRGDRPARGGDRATLRRGLRGWQDRVRGFCKIAAIAVAGEGRSVLVVCFNKYLGRFLSRCASEAAAVAGSTEARNFHSLVYRDHEALGWPMNVPEEAEAAKVWWEEDAALVLSEAAQTDAMPPFAAIRVNEARTSRPLGWTRWMSCSGRGARATSPVSPTPPKTCSSARSPCPSTTACASTCATRGASPTPYGGWARWR